MVINWKYIVIAYLLALLVGLVIILLIPSPPVVDFVGGLLDGTTFILVALFLIQKVVQLIRWLVEKQ